jgi:hypothetical protein
MLSVVGVILKRGFIEVGFTSTYLLKSLYVDEAFAHDQGQESLQSYHKIVGIVRSD